jgi:transcriptional regulator with GAF, ATPase, and Fis domain
MPKLPNPGRLRIDLPDAEGVQPAPGSARESRRPSRGHDRSGMRAHEGANILAALQACSAKVFGPGGAAEMLDIKPTTLASRIKAVGIANARGLAG